MPESFYCASLSEKCRINHGTGKEDNQKLLEDRLCSVYIRLPKKISLKKFLSPLFFRAGGGCSQAMERAYSI